MGLVQHEGGPCGVLATIQVMAIFFIIAYLWQTIHFSELFNEVPTSNVASSLFGFNSFAPEATFWIASQSNTDHRSP